VGRSEPETGRVLYPVEVLAMALNLVFAVGCLSHTGEVRTVILGLALDRELLMGTFFLLLTPLTLLLIRLINPVRGALARFIRLCYLQILLAVYIAESIWLSQLMFNGACLDSFFAGLDQMLFGFQPAVEFSRHLRVYPIVNEVFAFGYFFYYALVTTGVWVLFLRKRVHEAESVLFVIGAALFLMYAWYIFFPVKGPKYYLPELHASWYSEFHGYLFTGLMKWIFDRMNLAGAAFPSSHVAVGFVSLMLIWKHNRGLIAVYLPLTLLLLASAVYIYAHYFVDVAMGIPTGIFLYYLVPHLEPAACRAARRIDAYLASRLGFPPMVKVPEQASSRGRAEAERARQAPEEGWMPQAARAARSGEAAGRAEAGQATVRLRRRR
jgi:membrane-associated phospholipid phosphatase